ncbi:MAG: hypothetical protein ABR533_10800 [Desulfonatronovibrio sp.]
MNRPLIFSTLALGGLLLFSGTHAISKEKHDAEKLTSAKCSQCHNLERVEIARTMKDKKEWEKTVDRMISKKPGLLNDSERNTVIEFLTQD